MNDNEQKLKKCTNIYDKESQRSALFQGDCLDIMPLIPDKSVQLNLLIYLMEQAEVTYLMRYIQLL
jgi:hypothetical protein